MDCICNLFFMPVFIWFWILLGNLPCVGILIKRILKFARAWLPTTKRLLWAAEAFFCVHFIFLTIFLFRCFFTMRFRRCIFLVKCFAVGCVLRFLLFGLVVIQRRLFVQNSISERKVQTVDRMDKKSQSYAAADFGERKEGGSKQTAMKNLVHHVNWSSDCSMSRCFNFSRCYGKPFKGKVVFNSLRGEEEKRFCIVISSANTIEHWLWSS